MAKVTVDESLCTGCGLCASNCPEVFEIGDDNIAHVVSGECKTCDLKEVADQCPVNAIAVK
jgi:ferredoxin